MTSTLFSTSCYIKDESYQLRICIDDDSNKFSVSTIDDILSQIDTCASTSNTVNILDSIRLHIEPLTDKKKSSDPDNEDTIPEMIILNKILNIKKHTGKSSNENNEVTAQVDLSYIDISESFIWSVKQLQLEMNSTFAQQLHLISTRYLSKLKNRPRHLLAFVNPECGKGKGRSVYEKEVLPLFEEANIKVNTIYTERADHARDYIKEQSLDNYDGVISVGGDGMFSEVCHSLLLKTAQQAGLNIDDPNIDLIAPKLRIGVIPAGSTDAVAFGTTGHNDPITNTLQIIAGESLLIDIATIHSERGFVRFMATMFAYGFFGNVIEQSDNWRIFGPLRYTLAGVFQFIRNTSYHTELKIAQSPEKRGSVPSADSSDRYSSDNSIKRREIVDKVNDETDSEKSSSPLSIERKGHYRTINCLNMPCRCEKSKYGMSASVHLGDGSFDLVLVKHSWRLDFLRFLHHVANYRQPVEELSTVERFRTTEVVIRPIVSREKELGNWACDGELITANEIRVRAHHKALNLFASGIRQDQIKQINDDEVSITGSSYRFVFFFFLLLFSLFLCYYFFVL